MSDKKDITTNKLDGMLERLNSETEAERFINRYSSRGSGSFADYINEYIAKHNIEVNDIVSRSNISINYIYNILNGKRNPGRDKVIALCIGAGMSVREINRGLKIAKFGVLYAKDERDARIIIAVNRGISSVIDINIILEKHNLEILE
ncbi:MAG: helix-turn-helix domain-containing protein [Lentihominibacter sp.]